MATTEMSYINNEAFKFKREIVPANTMTIDQWYDVECDFIPYYAVVVGYISTAGLYVMEYNSSDADKEYISVLTQSGTLSLWNEYRTPPAERCKFDGNIFSYKPGSDAYAKMQYIIDIFGE